MESYSEEYRATLISDIINWIDAINEIEDEIRNNDGKLLGIKVEKGRRLKKFSPQQLDKFDDQKLFKIHENLYKSL